ncbi:MAG: RNA polymerase sigma factor [Myxococcota bacterium]
MKPFETLIAPHQDALRGYVHRMVGHRADAEDVFQTVLVKALERQKSLRSDASFRSWIFQIATRTCIDHLRRQTRWRPFSQRYIEDECHATPPKREMVFRATQEAEFAYDVREHVAFCFACVGRSLAPERQAAIVLREILGFTNQEAADILEWTEPTLRRRLAEGRREMEQTFDGLCSLINKDGVCRQCASFRNVSAKKGPKLPVLSPWEARTTIAREAHFLDGVSEGLHRVLFELIQALEARDANDS